MADLVDDLVKQGLAIVALSGINSGLSSALSSLRKSFGTTASSKKTMKKVTVSIADQRKVAGQKALSVLLYRKSSKSYGFSTRRSITSSFSRFI